MIEGILPKKDNESKENLDSFNSPEIKQGLKEMFFHEVVAAKIVDTYEKELINLGLKDSIDDLRDKILSMNVKDREYFYSFPWELKQRALPVFVEKIKKGEETIESMVDKIIEASKKQNRKLGYHCSSDNIVPKDEKVGAEKVKSWSIHGREKDHRDDDLPMAYYSFDYGHLYRNKRPNFIYLVSIQEGEKYGHRKDGHDEWGRAPSLSVIDKLDLKETDKMIEDFLNQELKKESSETTPKAA